MKLTLEFLNLEYVGWHLQFGEGRGEGELSGIRFGQYIHNKYDMSPYQTDIFHIESTTKAYTELLKEVYELEGDTLEQNETEK
jgi:hypothetical protein